MQGVLFEGLAGCALTVSWRMRGGALFVSQVWALLLLVRGLIGYEKVGEHPEHERDGRHR